MGIPKVCDLDLGDDSGDGERWIDSIDRIWSNNPFSEGTQCLERMPHALCSRDGKSRSQGLRKIRGGVLGTRVAEEG